MAVVTHLFRTVVLYIRIHRVFTLALNREPDASELAECSAVVEQYGLPTLCRVVFNSNEFLFVP